MGINFWKWHWLKEILLILNFKNRLKIISPDFEDKII